jgi:hypothetical protein
MNAAGSRTPADSQQHSNTEALRTHGVVPAAPVSWGSNLRIHRDEGCPLLSAIAARSSPAASMALLHLARWCGWRVAKWSRFPSVRLPEVLKAVNLCHCRWRSGTLVEDAGLSGRQMQQCPHPTPWCASTAPTSMAAACTPRAWPSCRPVCSAARSAVTGSCPTPRWGWSPPPSGPGSTRPPDRRKCSGKDLERATWTRRSGCWLPVVSYSHGGTTCLPCRQAWGFPAWQDHDRRPPQQRPPGRPESPLVGRPGHPTAVRPPAEGQVWPGSGIQGDHGQAESLR